MRVNLEGLTVLLPVYGGDDPGHFGEALDSILSQTHPCDELLIVVDGPIPQATERVIDERAEGSRAIRLLRMPRNLGLPRALTAGITASQGALIARMDADDIAHPDRLARQAKFLDDHQNIAVVGTQVREFALHPLDGQRVRVVPTESREIRKFARFRNPFNHMSVMFRKDAVLAVGSYEDWPGFEDYHLWTKLMNHGFETANLPDTLMYARTEGLYVRRGGWPYIQKEWRFRQELVRMGISSQVESVAASVGAGLVRISPRRLRRWTYDNILRGGL